MQVRLKTLIQVRLKTLGLNASATEDIKAAYRPTVENINACNTTLIQVITASTTENINANTTDVGPTLYKCYTNVLCLLSSGISLLTYSPRLGGVCGFFLSEPFI